MNWKLTLILSLFALGMAFATVYWIPNQVEAFFWLPIFIFSAWVIARRVEGGYSRWFSHGFILGIFNCIWITGVHVLLVTEYLDLNPGMQDMYNNPLIPNHPRLWMAIFGGFIGIASGIVIGFFAIIAARIMKRS